VDYTPNETREGGEVKENQAGWEHTGGKNQGAERQSLRGQERIRSIKNRKGKEKLGGEGNQKQTTGEKERKNPTSAREKS